MPSSIEGVLSLARGEADHRTEQRAKRAAAMLRKLDKLKGMARRTKSTAPLAEEAVRLIADQDRLMGDWASLALPFIEATDTAELAKALRTYIIERDGRE